MELVAFIIIVVGVLFGTPTASCDSPYQTDHPLVGQIVDAQSGKPLTQAALLNRMAGADYVILGEKHNNLDHHRIQADLVRALAKPGRQTALVFEQLRHNQTQQVATATTAEELRLAVQWDKQGWGPWSRYQGVFEAAYETGATVTPGDMARPLIRRVVKQGYDALPRPFRTRTKLASMLSPEQQDRLAEEIYLGHCKMMPKSMMGGMVKAQVARDAALTDAMVRAKSKADQVILIAGNGHALTDRAVPLHLNKRLGNPKTFTLGIVEVDGDQKTVEAVLRDKPPFDALWFTPVADTSDPCAAFTKQK